MRPSSRLEKIPPYLFAQLENKIAAKRAAGVDVISLGIGDPDTPTYPPIVAAAQQAVADPATHRYPTNRGRRDFRQAVADFYRAAVRRDVGPGDRGDGGDRSQGVHLQPEPDLPRPRRCCAGGRPGLSGLHGWTLDGGCRARLDAARAGAWVRSGPAQALCRELGRAKLLFFNYPNNPTGAVVPDGLFEDVVALARERDLLAVHDNAYSETTYDGYVAPSFLATPGAKEVGVEVFSLSKGYNMTGWRCAAIVGNAEAIAHFWQLKSNVDSGLFEAVQLAGVAALQPAVDADVAAMNAVYARRRDLVCAALAQSGVRVTKPKGTIYVWAPIPVGFESSPRTASTCSSARRS